MRKIAIFLVFCGVAACLPLLAAQPAYLTLWPASGEPVCYALGDMPRMEIKDGKLKISARGVAASAFPIAEVNRITFEASMPNKLKKNAPREDALGACFLYRKDGSASALAFANLRRVVSFGDSLRVEQKDTSYMVAPADIDSIGFHGFPTVYDKRVVKLDPYIEYVECVDSLGITFSASLPKKMELKAGQIVLYEGLCPTFPKGIARMVGSVEKGSSFRINTRQAAIDEVYETLFVYGNYEMKEEEEPSLALVKKSGSMAAETGAQIGKNKFNVGFGGDGFTISTGHLSVTLDGGLNPNFNVLITKSSAVASANVDITIDIAFWAKATANAKIEKSAEKRTPWVILIPELPIPECPIVSVGLWGDAFVKIYGEGSATAALRYDGHVKCVGGYNASKGVYASGSYTSKFSEQEFSAELKGGIMAGVGIYPHVGVLEGCVTYGPYVDMGPKLEADLKIDIFKGLFEGAYSALLDCKATLSLEAEAKGRVSTLINSLTDEEKEWEAKTGSHLAPKKKDESSFKLTYSLPIAERWFLPLFTTPRVITTNEGQKTAFVSTNVSRPLVFPVTVGYEIQQSEEQLYTYEEPETYWAPEKDLQMIHEFSGFHYKTPYKAIPTVTLMGFKMKAVPTSNFHFTPEIDTRVATEIEKEKAVLNGHIGDLNDPTLREYGFYYRMYGAGEKGWKKVASYNANPAEGSFSAKIANLLKETPYEFYAYAIYGEEECRGDLLTFKTLGDGPVGPYVEKCMTDSFLIIKSNGDIVAKIGNIGYMGNPNEWWYKYDYSSRYVYHYYERQWLRPHNEVHWFVADEEEMWREDPEMNYGREHYMHHFWEALLWFCNDDEEEAQRRLFKNYYVGDEEVLGVKCWHFNTYGMLGFDAEYWIDPENGICLREVSRDGRGGEKTDELQKYDKNYHSWSSEIKPR